MAEEEQTQQPRKHGEESVKLFVGQVPKHMTEAQLLAMFAEFAIVDEVNIIKDKTTRASRGSDSLSSEFFYVLDRNVRFERFVDFFFLL